MKYILGILLALTFTVVNAQTETEEVKAVTNYNLVKIGSSIQVNINYYSHYDYYDEFGYYYDDEYIYKSGPNSHLFLAYEHIWQFTKSNTAVGIEPQIGFSFFDYLTTGYTGANIKFYWLNKPNFRMGMASYFGYTYASQDRTVSVPMDGGMYYQNKDVTNHYNQFSGDISLIPFHFRVKGAPITIESQFALFGFNATKVKSERFDNGYDDGYYFNDTRGSIYALKFELKIGFEF